MGFVEAILKLVPIAGVSVSGSGYECYWCQVTLTGTLTAIIVGLLAWVNRLSSSSISTTGAASAATKQLRRQRTERFTFEDIQEGTWDGADAFYTRYMNETWAGKPLLASPPPSLNSKPKLTRGKGGVPKRAPVVFRRLGQKLGWRALDTWSVEWFAGMVDKKGGETETWRHKDVSVSISNEETEMTAKCVMPLDKYARKLRKHEMEQSDKLSWRAVGYLKQLDIVELMGTTLQEYFNASDLFHPKRYWLPGLITQYFWMGPSLAVTGLHSDDENNCLVQISGHKRVIMVPPDQKSLLYVNTKYDSGTQCCDANPLAWMKNHGGMEMDGSSEEKQRASEGERRCHPLFGDATPYVTVLTPGDVLYIPRGWYHHVSIPKQQHSQLSLSINVFASTPIEMIREGFPRLVLHVMHKLGLYRKGNCVCHC